MSNKKLDLNTNLLAEIIRFAVVGVYGTLIDYVCEVWMTSLLNGWSSTNHLMAFFIQFVIGLVGFIIATPSTWSLSAVWAFRNIQDEKKAKSLKGSIQFTFWAFLGLLGGSIIQFLGYMICLEWSGLGINILDINFSTLFKSDIATFWSYTIVFVLRTMYTMVWNYLTRKFIIYKAPKKEEAPEVSE